MVAEVKCEFKIIPDGGILSIGAELHTSPNKAFCGMIRMGYYINFDFDLLMDSGCLHTLAVYFTSDAAKTSQYSC